ncbi:MAG: hypothetical protein ABIZ52_02930 [Candidatus Limnocylindrales bacterium]
MALWHCPHCGAPQAETARCWVCRRSSTTCSTCRHFRVSLAADLGYCALDRQRRPLTGRELRGCWEERPLTGLDQGKRRTAERPIAAAHPLGAPIRGFVPLDEVLPAGPPVAAGPGSLPEVTATILRDAADAWDTRTSLFGEAEH